MCSFENHVIILVLTILVTVVEVVDNCIDGDKDHRIVLQHHLAVLVACIVEAQIAKFNLKVFTLHSWTNVDVVPSSGFRKATSAGLLSYQRK